MLSHSPLLRQYKEARKSSLNKLHQFLAGDDFALAQIVDLKEYPDGEEFVKAINHLLEKELQGTLTSRERLLLANAYFTGRGIKPNHKYAYEYFLKLKETEPFALVCLGYIYLEGEVVAINKETSLDYFMQAMNEKEIFAYHVGYYYLSVLNQVNRALDYIFISADLGCTYAYGLLGQIKKALPYDPFVQERLPEKLSKEFTLMAAQNGCATSLATIGLDYESRGGSEIRATGMEYLQEAIKSGESNAYLHLAESYKWNSNYLNAARCFYKVFKSTRAQRRYQLNLDAKHNLMKRVETLLDMTTGCESRAYTNPNFEAQYICLIILNNKMKKWYAKNVPANLIKKNSLLFAEISLNYPWEPMTELLNEDQLKIILPIRTNLLDYVFNSIQEIEYTVNEEVKIESRDEYKKERLTKQFPTAVTNIMLEYFAYPSDKKYFLDRVAEYRLHKLNEELITLSEKNANLFTEELEAILVIIPKIQSEIKSGNIQRSSQSIDLYLKTHLTNTEINILIKQVQQTIYNYKAIKANIKQQKLLENSFEKFISVMQKTAHPKTYSVILKNLSNLNLTEQEQQFIKNESLFFEFETMQTAIKNARKTPLNLYYVELLADYAIAQLTKYENNNSFPTFFNSADESKSVPNINFITTQKKPGTSPGLT